MGTRIAEKIPNAFKGIMGESVHEMKAIEEVAEVTNIARHACLKVKVSRRIGYLSNARIWKVDIQKSWKTKMSSAPIPIITRKAKRC